MRVVINNHFPTISIHALLAESDPFHDLFAVLVEIFLSTLSLRRATSLIRRAVWAYYISIHALLAESDQLQSTCRLTTPYISIHALLAESDATAPNTATIPADFYPRSPCGERLPLIQSAINGNIISIHALLAESDGGGL